MKKSKKGQDLLTGTIIFIILNVAFFSIMLFFVIRSSEGDALFEQREAKKIAFAIDQLKSETQLEINLFGIYERAGKNNIKENIIIPDYEKGTITVRVVDGEGKTVYFFTKLKPGSIELDEKNKLLIIKNV